MKYQKSNLDFVKASLVEFAKIWAVGGSSMLCLESFGGHAFVSLKADLGPPGWACFRATNGRHHDRPSKPVPMFERRQRPRHRGPAAKQRSRIRAAKFQEELRKKLAVRPQASPSPTTVSTSSPLPPPRTNLPPPPPSSPPPTAAAPPTTPKPPSLPQCESPSSPPCYGWSTPVVKKRWKPPSSAFVKSPHTKLHRVKDKHSDSHSRRSQWRDVKVASR